MSLKVGDRRVHEQVGGGCVKGRVDTLRHIAIESRIGVFMSSRQ